MYKGIHWAWNKIFGCGCNVIEGEGVAELENLEQRVLLSVTVTHTVEPTPGMEGYSTYEVTVTTDEGMVAAIGVVFSAESLGQVDLNGWATLFDNYPAAAYEFYGYDIKQDSHFLFNENEDDLLLPPYVNYENDTEMSGYFYIGEADQFVSKAVAQLVVPNGYQLTLAGDVVVDTDIDVEIPVDTVFDVVPAVPVVSTEIEDAEVRTDDELVIDLSQYFSDVEDDVLTYEVTGNTDATVASAVIDGKLLTITGLDNLDVTTITVSATDSDDQTVSDSFVVTVVDNYSPVVVQGVNDVVLHVNDGDALIDLTGVFYDTEDGSDLTLSVISSNEAVATATVVGQTVTLSVAENTVGHSIVTVTATDEQGAVVEDEFLVTVINYSPEVETLTSDIQVHVNSVDSVIDLSDAFSDLEDENLTITAESSDEELVTVAVSGNQLTLSYVADALGQATVTIRATDVMGAFVEDEFVVNVVNDSPVVTQAVGEITMSMNDDVVIDLANVFEDTEDGDSLTYEVVENTNEDLLSTEIAAGELTLSGAADSKGQATVTVRATDGQGAFVEDTFTVTVGFEVAIGMESASGVKSLVFSDDDGSVVTVTLNGAGVANILFAGSNLAMQIGGKSIAISGNNISIDAIELTGTDAKTTLDIKVKGGSDKLTEVGDITADGQMKAINAKDVDLLGDIDIDGSLLSLTLHDVDAAHTIEIGSSGNEKDSLTFKANRVVDTALTSEIAIKNISVVDWRDVDGLDNDSVTGPTLSKLTVSGNNKLAIAGNFDADLNGTVTDLVLGNASIKGAVTDSMWMLAGSAGSITAATFTDWTATFENVKSITSQGNFTGQLDGDTIKSLTVKGHWDADLNLAGSDDISTTLGSAKISGTLTNSEWVVTGKSGNLTMEAVSDWSATLRVVKSVKVNDDFAGDVTGEAIGSIKIGGDYDGDLTLTGSDEAKSTLGGVKIGGLLDDSTWNVAGMIGAMAMGAVDEWSATLGVVKSIKVSGAVSESEINGEAIGSIKTDGTFACDLTLTGSDEVKSTLGGVNVKGGIQASEWNIAEVTGSISAGSISLWTATFGEVKSISSKTNIQADITADSVKSINVTGNMVATSLDLNLGTDDARSKALGGVKVKGQIQGGVWDIEGHVGSVTAGAIVDGVGTFVMDVEGDVKGLKSGGQVKANIEANSLGSIAAKESYEGNMNLAGVGITRNTLGGVKVGGAMIAGEWVVVGNVGGVSFDSVTAWDATMQEVKSISVKQNAAMDLTAQMIKGLTVKGNLADSTVTVTQGPDAKIKALSSLNVNGEMSNSQVRSAGNIGSATVGMMTGNSLIFAGVDASVTGLPAVDEADMFDQLASIGKVTLKGTKVDDAFVDSCIAAWTIGSVNSKEVGLTVGGDEFGVVADSIGSVSMMLDGEKLSVKKLDDPALAADMIDATGLNLENLVIRVF